MTARRWTFITYSVFAAIVTLLSTASAAVTVDRNYRLGDDPAEGASNGGAVNATFDSAGQPGQGQLIDLTAVNTPVYRTITGRPDGVGGLGIEFNGAQQEYLRGPRLGLPSTSISSVGGGGTIDYTGISDRGLQFWVKPSGVGVQTLVMDTNQHGARIDAAGKFSMRYAGADFASNVTATAGTWFHVEVVRPAGAANGSRMYVNGIAVAAAPGGYTGADSADLVVGANTGGDDTNFTGGNAEFFTGIIDDLKLFVMGSNAAANYGTFNLGTDNEFVVDFLTGVAGDITNDGVLNQSDKNAFVAGWMDQKLVNGIRVGDLSTYGAGDLNFDGITNVFDLATFLNALTGAGVPAFTPAEIAALGVPEPSTALLLVLGAVAMRATSRGRRR